MKTDLDVAVLKFSEDIGLTVSTIIEKLAVDVHSGVTKRTPVDTGRARASWMISQGDPDLSVAPDMGDGDGKNKGAGSPPSDPIIPPPTIKSDGESKVWITNSLPYIERLENGHSKQAPAGMVAVTIAQIMTEFEAVTGSV